MVGKWKVLRSLICCARLSRTLVEYPVWVDGFFDRAALDRLDTGGLAGEGYGLVISIFM